MSDFPDFDTWLLARLAKARVPIGVYDEKYRAIMRPEYDEAKLDTLIRDALDARGFPPDVAHTWLQFAKVIIDIVGMPDD